MVHITHLSKDKKFKKIIDLQQPYILTKKKNAAFVCFYYEPAVKH